MNNDAENNISYDLFIVEIEYFNKFYKAHHLFSKIGFYQVIYPKLKYVLENINQKENQDILNEILKMDLKPHLRKRLIVTIGDVITMFERRRLRLGKEKKEIEKEKNVINFELNQEINNLNQKIEILRNALFEICKEDAIEGFDTEYLIDEVIFEKRRAARTEETPTIKIIFPFEEYDEIREVKGFDTIETLLRTKTSSQFKTLVMRVKDLGNFNRTEDRLYLVPIKGENLNPIPLSLWDIYDGLYEFLILEDIERGKLENYSIFYKNGSWWIEEVKELKELFEELSDEEIEESPGDKEL